MNLLSLNKVALRLGWLLCILFPHSATAAPAVGPARTMTTLRLSVTMDSSWVHQFGPRVGLQAIESAIRDVNLLFARTLPLRIALNDSHRLSSPSEDPAPGDTDLTRVVDAFRMANQDRHLGAGDLHLLFTARRGIPGDLASSFYEHGVCSSDDQSYAVLGYVEDYDNSPARLAAVIAAMFGVPSVYGDDDDTSVMNQSNPFANPPYFDPESAAQFIEGLEIQGSCLRKETLPPRTLGLAVVRRAPSRLYLVVSESDRGSSRCSIQVQAQSGRAHAITIASIRGDSGATRIKIAVGGNVTSTLKTRRRVIFQALYRCAGSTLVRSNQASIALAPGRIPAKRAASDSSWLRSLQKATTKE